MQPFVETTEISERIRVGTIEGQDFVIMHMAKIKFIV
jgi:hypothetical protein